MSCGCSYACIRYPNLYTRINKPYSFKYLFNYGNNGGRFGGSWRKARLVSRPLVGNLAGKQEEMYEGEDESDRDDKKLRGLPFDKGNSAIISSCFVGLFTGIGVVLFNNAVRPPYIPFLSRKIVGKLGAFSRNSFR